jgi:hypothetical protein
MPANQSLFACALIAHQNLADDIALGKQPDLRL